MDALQQQLADQQELLDLANEVLAVAPDDEASLEDKSSAEAAIRDLKARIASHNGTKQASSNDTWANNNIQTSISQAPIQTPSAPAPPVNDVPPPPADYKIGDTVLAKYSEDKNFYPASIITITGSSADPVYTVRFKGYGNTETLRMKDIKPQTNKRKASPPPHVIVAPPIKTPSMVGDGPTRQAPAPKKLKNTKALEKSQNNWQNFMKGGKQKDSMFRTGDLPGAKVGFVGSGKGMSKDQIKTRQRYTKDE